MKIEDFLNLDIGERFEFNAWSDIMRVPGGWVYNTWNGSADEGYLDNATSCFIPEPTPQPQQKKREFLSLPNGAIVDISMIVRVGPIDHNILPDPNRYQFFIQTSNKDQYSGELMRFMYNTPDEQAEAETRAKYWHKRITDAVLAYER